MRAPSRPALRRTTRPTCADFVPTATPNRLSCDEQLRTSARSLRATATLLGSNCGSSAEHVIWRLAPPQRLPFGPESLLFLVVFLKIALDTSVGATNAATSAAVARTAAAARTTAAAAPAGAHAVITPAGAASDAPSQSGVPAPTVVSPFEFRSPEPPFSRDGTSAIALWSATAASFGARASST